MKIFTFLLMLCPVLMFGQAQEANMLGTWNDPSLVGSTIYNNTYNEIWGHVIDGKEYAIIGSTAGTHFIDVTDPNTPTETVFIAGAVQGGQIIHRDFHNLGNLLYVVCDEGNSSLQIMDMTNLSQGEVEVVYDSNELLRTAHNIFIDQDNAILYTFATNGGTPGYSALRLYSLDDPLNPVFLGKYNNFGGLQVGHVHDGYVKNNIAYLNCGGSGFAIVDFTDPASPVTLSTLTEYPQQGYNHSGWLSEDATYYYMADENHGKAMKIINVEDMSEIEVTGTFDAESPEASSIPHNQIVVGNYLYVSYYYDGLQVYDITDPANPERAFYYDTFLTANDNSYRGSWGVYPFLPSGNVLVSDMQTGLYVLSIDADVSGVEDLDFVTELSLEPHPVQDQLNVNIKLIERKAEVNLDLLDITGRVVQRLDHTDLVEGENRLNYYLNDHLQAGLYVLRLSGADFVLTQKVVKQ